MDVIKQKGLLGCPALRAPSLMGIHNGSSHRLNGFEYV